MAFNYCNDFKDVVDFVDFKGLVPFVNIYKILVAFYLILMICYNFFRCL